MDQPLLRPPLAPVADCSAGTHSGARGGQSAASPKPKRRIRPGWKSTIVRTESFARLRDIQKSTSDPVIDLSYLADACLQLALELGPDAIVKRAVSSLRPTRSTL